MAGDWIKVEITMPDKPEVSRLAQVLSIDHDAAVGKLLRFWIWSDQQSVDGNDINVTPAFIDRLTNCPGFADALVSVGWLIGRNSRLSIPNFNRHNGQTAKNRALTKNRVKRSRNDSIVTKALPEKRREEKRRILNTSPNGEVSSEPLRAASEPPILIFPIVGKDGNLWSLTAHQVQKLSAAFPGVDVLAEARKALAWCEANPTKRKTSRGMAAFLFRWMEKAQNCGKSSGSRHRVLPVGPGQVHPNEGSGF